MPALPCADEQVLYQAAVDHTFRSALMEQPTAFGIDRNAVRIPDAVEPQDQATLNFWREAIAAIEVYGCVQSCSFGPITAICDGNTK